MRSNNNEQEQEQQNAGTNNEQQQKEEQQQKPVEEDEDFEMESLSREDLIQLVKLTKQQLKERTTKMEELTKALLASQQKVEKMTAEMAKANVEEQQDFQRIVQLQEENEQMRIKLAEATEEKQIVVPNMQMKVQLPLENWTDLLGFVPRRQLVKLLFQIWHLQFGKILQFFLNKCGEVTLGCMEIIPPDSEDPYGRPMVRVRRRPVKTNGYWKMELTADVPMPGNVNNFESMHFSHFDPSVLHFLHKFEQNSLMENVNLQFLTSMSSSSSKMILNQILPLISSINSIYFWDAPVFDRCSQLEMQILAMTRIVQFSGFRDEYLIYNDIDLWCHWLNAPTDDGKARMLISSLICQRNFQKINHYIEHIKKVFIMSNHPSRFFIRHEVPSDFECEQHSLDNGQTNEKLVVRMVEMKRSLFSVKFLLISRYPMGATKEWIETIEQEAMDCNFLLEHGREINFWPSLENFNRIRSPFIR